MIVGATVEAAVTIGTKLQVSGRRDGLAMSSSAQESVLKQVGLRLLPSRRAVVGDKFIGVWRG